MTRHTLMTFVGVLGAGWAGAALAMAPSTEEAPEEAAPALPVYRASGEYELTYFGRRLGTETFEIERDEAGWRITATLEARGDQPSCRSEYRLDADRRFVSATFGPTDAGQVGATYRIDGTTLIATSEDGQEQRVALGPDDIVAGPHYVTDFWVLEPLEIGVGDRVTRTVHTFGFKNWRVYPSEVKCVREKDKMTNLPKGRTKARLLRCTIDTGEDTFKTGSWIDGDGVSRRISISAPIGSANVRLRSLTVDGEVAP